MNLGYLWKALYNERVISAVDDWWRDNVADNGLLLFWRDRKNMQKVQAVVDQDQDQNNNNNNRSVTGNVEDVGGSGRIYNDGRPMNGDIRLQQQQQRPRRRRRRHGNDDSSKYLDNHVRY